MLKRCFGAAIGVAAIAATVAPATMASAATTSGSKPPLYNSTVAPGTVGNLDSEGAEAYSFSEFGNQVHLAGTKLGKVIVELSTWGCQQGNWYSGNCSTSPGATFIEPITFNIYNAPDPGTPDKPGSLISTTTKPFNIPYRPSANLTHCNGPQGSSNGIGKWWDSKLHECFNGKAFTISFPFKQTLPSQDIVFGIAYNTTHYGYNPIGESAPCYNSSGGCGYDSLNIALSSDPDNVTAGSDPNPGTLWQNASSQSQYCDGGADGTGTFRLDSPSTTPSNSCWSIAGDGNAPYYVPAVEFTQS